ncbi:N-acylglucosamine-6-phosphate 2-epimerase [Nicoletella semolina]|uniref:Putative N-acetylmannosamine-6-phosphate 2-epimerase n=1 Tax=Nicoletella semolina TaxID=271160 RepID=A0A4R2N632_9PAST|nr:N-acetylmannosamine-6-phosphate 2-epimerase [Nicoletella semolina]MDH2925277.1 N-acetylmannosamine-6-phosphate 2-epimerase [Nicoletella semolina]TCP16362.1 N-acylglucosamine-6-phosphate 2-epimerase [Nicoletella semolina]
MSRLSKESILSQIKQGLIASCQPVDNGPMDSPEIVAAMAAASVAGGAVGLRIEGIENLKAARKAVDVPIVGIVKYDLDDSPVRITPFLQDIDDLFNAGADIIAFDGTDRVRPTTIEACVKRIQELGAMSMADCSNLAEGLYCQSLGVDLIGSTMSGYTGGETPKGPDVQLVRDLVANGCRVMAEGRYNSPELAALAIENGAYAVTVGSALTRLEHIVSWFVDAIADCKTDCKKGA